jgi:AMMECR1 domain-containing protein
MTHKDPTFHEVYKLEMEERKCSICLLSDEIPMKGEPMYTCRIGTRWPKYGKCWYFIDSPEEIRRLLKGRK